MRPRPAATATGLWDTTQIFPPGKRSISIGKPIAGFSARTPSRSRVATILRATSLTRSPVWWNSRLATDRAVLRIGSRFVRQTKLRRVLALGFFPGRDRLLDQSSSLGRQPEWLGTGILIRHDLQPAVRLQRLDVAAQGRGIQLQNLADLGWPGEAEAGGHDRDIQLAHLQAQGPQSVVVKVRHDPVQKEQAHDDARPGDRVDAAGRGFV